MDMNCLRKQDSLRADNWHQKRHCPSKIGMADSNVELLCIDLALARKIGGKRQLFPSKTARSLQKETPGTFLYA